MENSSNTGLALLEQQHHTASFILTSAATFGEPLTSQKKQRNTRERRKPLKSLAVYLTRYSISSRIGWGLTVPQNYFFQHRGGSLCLQENRYI